MENDLFINKDGKALTPDPSDPEWNDYLANIAQTSLGTFKLFGMPDIESYKDYMGIVTIVINLFMLDTPEKKAEYLQHLIKVFESNKRKAAE